MKTSGKGESAGGFEGEDAWGHFIDQSPKTTKTRQEPDPKKKRPNTRKRNHTVITSDASAAAQRENEVKRELEKTKSELIASRE